MTSLLKIRPISWTFVRRLTFNNKDIETFVKIVNKNCVKTEDLDLYNTDWLHTHKGLTVDHNSLIT